MKILPLIIGVLLTCFYSSAQSFQWAKSIGSSNTEYALSTTADAAGNVYTTGSFGGTVDFNPGTGVYNLVSQGGADIFIQKLDPSGNFVWAVSMGGTSIDVGRSIKIDIAGNVYTTGSFYSSNVDFNPGAGTNILSSAGSADIFIQKLDANGNFLWAKRMGGTSDDLGFSLNVDVAGNCFTTGVFRGTVDFNPGTGITNLTSAGNGDIFVQKLDASGNLLWVKGFGGASNDESYSSCLDANGNIYTNGYFQGIADFDPAAGTQNLSSFGTTDGFIQKLDVNGNLLWVKQIGGTSFDYCFSVATDPIGNVYSTGYFVDTADFNPGIDVYALTSAGQADIFVLKMDGSGNFVWVRQIGGSGNDYTNSISSDNHGDVYITGQFEQTVDFNPGPGTDEFSSVGGSDVFVQKMNSSGTFLRAKTFGGNGAEQSNAICIDNLFNIGMAGKFQQTVDFDPSINTTNLTSLGGDDAFVEKMSQCYTAPVTHTITACDSYTWIDGITYTASNNTATLTLDQFGCDQVNTLNLTINYSTTGTDLQTACDSYTWIDGNTYTSSTSAPTWTLTNALGCDSIVTLNLTILSSSIGTDVQTACDSYTWVDGNTYTTSTNTPTFVLTNAAGCDSIATLNLTILNTNGIDSQSACSSYTWIDGNTYTSSTSTPTFVLTNAAGCDSTVTLNLTIQNNTGIDTQTACESYTWIDGNTYYSSTNSPIWTLTNVAGCDSVVTLNLTVNNSSSGIDVQVSDCEEFTWIDGLTYTTATNSPTWTLSNAAGCDSIVTLNLSFTAYEPTIIQNTFSLPSDPNTCVGEFAVDISGNEDFELDIDNGSQTEISSGYSLFIGLCPGVHDLQIVNSCGDTTTTQFVIPVDSNYVFTNPFIDSLAQDSLGATIENCDIYYAGIDTAYIDSIWATGNTVTVIWNIVDSNGSNLDTTNYELNNGNGVYWLQLSVFCPTKALGDYFTVTEAIYFEDGDISTAGIADREETSVQIYPNPTNSLVTVSFDGNQAELVIYDAQGKLIQNHSSIQSGQQVSLANVQTGVYFFELRTSDSTTTKKIIKQ